MRARKSAIADASLRLCSQDGHHAWRDSGESKGAFGSVTQRRILERISRRRALVLRNRKSGPATSACPDSRMASGHRLPVAVEHATFDLDAFARVSGRDEVAVKASFPSYLPSASAPYLRRPTVCEGVTPRATVAGAFTEQISFSPESHWRPRNTMLKRLAQRDHSGWVVFKIERRPPSASAHYRPATN